MTSLRSSWTGPLTLAGILWISSASADAPPAHPAQDSSTEPATPIDPVTTDVRAHHRRGLELFDEGDYRLALVEFERAYAIGKSYKVLFNIGQVYFQLNRYAKARSVLERYLAEGGDAITPERRADVERDLTTLRARTATLTVHANVRDAEVAIDDTILGKSPLDNALVDAGDVRIRVTRNGYVQRIREVTLAGGDVQTITVDLVEAKPDVVVTTTGLPGAAIASWITTGILAAGAIGTGIAASSASSEYDTKRESPIAGSPQRGRADLERQRDLVNGLALTTDILAITTLVAGGVALYLTLRERPRTDAPRPQARTGPGVLSLGMEF